ncbi:MAG: hypothetical protein ACXIVF_04525 [Rhizobiaceae bacterium]
MPDPFRNDVKIVLDRLDTDRTALANRLGLAIGALRAWEARGAPAYGRLALAALATGLDPDKVFQGELIEPMHESRCSQSTRGDENGSEI